MININSVTREKLMKELRMTSTTAQQSATVDVLTAEVRVLQVGSRQVTLSVYRQLDQQWDTDHLEAFGRVRDDRGKHEPGLVQIVGRDTETGALVRHDATHPDWTTYEGPDEFAHWLIHKKPKRPAAGRPWNVAESERRHVSWTGTPSPHRTICTSTYHWHISDSETPHQLDWYIQRPELNGSRERLERAKQERCTVDLDELERYWRSQAEEELADLLEAQAEYDRLKALPLIVLAGLK